MVYPPSQMLSAKVDWRWVPENSSEPKNIPQNSINHTQYPSLRYTKSSLILACFLGTNFFFFCGGPYIYVAWRVFLNKNLIILFSTSSV
jgi:hypothetical protein